MATVGKIAVGLALGVALISGGLGPALAEGPTLSAADAALDGRLKQTRSQSYRYPRIQQVVEGRSTPLLVDGQAL